MKEVQTQRYINSIDTIERLYDFLNERYFESALSKPIITIQADNSNKSLGWFIPLRIWKDGQGYREFEINVSANFLDCAIEEAAGVLLHEMCHQYCYENHIKDTSRSGIYHNKRYITVAETHGLKWLGKEAGDGYTELLEETKETLSDFHFTSSMLYRKTTEEDYEEYIRHEALCNLKKQGYMDIDNIGLSKEGNAELTNLFEAEVQKVREKRDKSGERKSSTRKYICPQCGQSVRATKEVNIICGVCNLPMAEVGSLNKNNDGQKTNEI